MHLIVHMMVSESMQSSCRSALAWCICVIYAYACALAYFLGSRRHEGRRGPEQSRPDQTARRRPKPTSERHRNEGSAGGEAETSFVDSFMCKNQTNHISCKWGRVIPALRMNNGRAMFDDRHVCLQRRYKYPHARRVHMSLATTFCVTAVRIASANSVFQFWPKIWWRFAAVVGNLKQ